MEKKLNLYNTLSKKKEVFNSISDANVGVYLCGPTVYGYAHIGHARSAIAVDVLIRVLKFLNYKVRYVRNITDVGHLERDSDEGNDKILKQAILEEIEPMEIVNKYTFSYREDLNKLNVIPPNIEPCASGHIIEQIEYIKKIISKGYAYEKDGSVYFDVKNYSRNFKYGELSGRVLEELKEESRSLNNQSQKNFFADFALWKKAEKYHIMKWESPWGLGYPGWHIECSVMSQKYLGENFDIHAGGMDLLFPHHECEIAQNEIVNNHKSAKFWFHNNMVTINNTKMAKSLENFITLQQLFSGENKILDKAYSPMTLRFCILQAHYRSTLAFSNESLKAAEAGYKKIMNGMRSLNFIEKNIPQKNFSKIKTPTSEKINSYINNIHEAILDDLNTAKAIAFFFDVLKIINSLKSNSEKAAEITFDDFLKIKKNMQIVVYDILGLKSESQIESDHETINFFLEKYKNAKAEKNFEEVDSIRKFFLGKKIGINDLKTGIEVVEIL